MTAATLVSDRAVGEALLEHFVANIDGAQAIFIEMPSTMGDVLLDQVFIQVENIATMMTTPELNGVALRLLGTSTSTFRDVVGTTRWVPTGTNSLAASWEMRRKSRLWLTGESLHVRFAEVDTNAVPTADLAVEVRVRRLRQ